MRNKKSKKAEFEFGAIENPPKQPISAESAKNQYFEILNYQKKQKNGLLGEYDASGKYKIADPKILQSLLEVPKKFEDKQDNVVYASAKKDNLILNFKIIFNIDVDYSSAELYLIEVEHGIEEDIKHLIKLDDYLAVNSATFRDEVFSAWKIWVDAEVYEKNDQLFEYLRYQNEEFLFNRELTEILSQLYVVRLLKILEASGQLGQKIIEEYKLFLEKKQGIDPDFHLSYTNLKEVLDHFMLKHNAFEEVLKNPEAAVVLQGYSQPIKRFKDKIPVTEINIEKKEEKKEEKKAEKKAEPKKAKAKAKAKSGGKPSKIDLKYGGKTYSALPSPKPPEKTKETKAAAPKAEVTKTKDKQEKVPKVEKQEKVEPVADLAISSFAADFLKESVAIKNEPKKTVNSETIGGKQQEPKINTNTDTVKNANAKHATFEKTLDL